MDYVLCGTDRRIPYLAKLLLQSGHRVFFWETRYTVEGANNLRSPLELHDPVRLLLPFTENETLLSRAIDTLPIGSTICGGREPAAFSDRVRRRDLRYRDLTASDRFCRENAAPTAEGALAALIRVTPDALASTRVLLSGYGRVARAVADLLSRTGVSVTVAARRRAARKEAEDAGFGTLKLPIARSKYKRLSDFSALINTVPAEQILDASLLGALPDGIPVLELASGKENIDREAAQKTEHPIIDLPSLPGQVAPRSAARALALALQESEK